jgi:hypothetical protein
MFAGCEKEPVSPARPVERDDETAVTFMLNATSPVETRANENALSNIQLLLVGSAGRYYFNPAAPNFTARIRQGTYEVYAAANFPESIKYLDDNALSALYAGYSNEEKLPMSFRGTANFATPDAMNYIVKLTRTVAKMRFNITAADGVKIHAWQICNQPTGAALFKSNNLGQSYDNGQRTTLSGKAFTAYISENLAGTVGSITDQQQRIVENAPANATYLRMEGTLADNSPVEYRIYLGGNETNDFNIRRNNNYAVNINIKGPSVTDLRILNYSATHSVKTEAAPGSDLLSSPEVYFHPSFSTSAPEIYPDIKYAYTFSGHPLMKLSVVVNGRVVSDSAMSGTLRAGQTQSFLISYVPKTGVFTPENNKVTYKLTFTDTRGNLTEYTGVLKFANKLTAYVVGRNDDSGTKPVMGAISLPDGQPFSCDDNGDIYNIYFLGNKVKMKASPTSTSYKFWCWCNDPSGQGQISTSPTIEREVTTHNSRLFALFLK